MNFNYLKLFTKSYIMSKILLFKMSTCGPCKLLSKLFTQLNIQKEDIVLDEDDNADTIADKYNVKSVPTVVVLNNEGEELGRFVGYKSKEQLLEELDKYKIFDNE